jgi:hypothetical protein
MPDRIPTLEELVDEYDAFDGSMLRDHHRWSRGAAVLGGMNAGSLVGCVIAEAWGVHTMWQSYCLFAVVALSMWTQRLCCKTMIAQLITQRTRRAALVALALHEEAKRDRLRAHLSTCQPREFQS